MRGFLALIVVALAALPASAQDRTLTPGATRFLSTARVCAIKWGTDRRHVTDDMRRQVAESYGVKLSDIHRAGEGPCCELDHLIPRELAGDDKVENLWPQP